MVKYIEFGKYNKNYNFIFITVVFNVLVIYFPKFLIALLLKYNKISNRVEELYNNSILRLFFLLFMFAFSCILNKYESKLFKRKSNFDKLSVSNTGKGCFKKIKINEEKKKKKEKLNNKKNLLNILIIVIIILFSENILVKVDALIIFSYSMIVLLILSFINTKMFNIKIYKHQKCAILFNFSVLFIFGLSSFILTMESENDDYIYTIYLANPYRTYNLYYIRNYFIIWLFKNKVVYGFKYDFFK